MIVRKPADLDPAIKSALKSHIMRKRLQLKQELEQDAIEKRLKREQEAKRKQDAMTLDQLKEQLSQLQKTLEHLGDEKTSLFAQLKQIMSTEDDARRKRKEGEINATRQQQQQLQQQQHLQQQQQHQQQHQQQQQQQQQQPPLLQQPSQPLQQQQSSQPHNDQIRPQQLQHQQQQRPQHLSSVPPLPQQQQQTSTINGTIQTGSTSNQENHIPLLPRDKPHEQQNQPSPHMFHQQQQQTNHHDQDTLQNNSHQPNSTHLQQRTNSIFNPAAAAFSHLLNAHANFPRQSPYLPHHPQPNRPSNPYGPMSSYPPLGHHQPSLLSGHGIPTSLPHVPQNNPMIRPSPPPPMNSGQLNSGPPKLSMSLPITSSGPPTQIDFNPNLSTSTAYQMQQQALSNSAAATAAAAAVLGIPYGSPYFNSNSPIGASLSLEQHHALLNAAASSHNHLTGNGNNSLINNNNSNNNSNVNNLTSNSSRVNSLPPMKRPMSNTNMPVDTISPSKKLHTQPPPANQPHQLPPSLSSPYLSYPGLPPGLGSAGGPPLSASLFGQNLIRTPPPPNISSLFNSAAFSHLLNAHAGFPRQSPYLTHLPQSNRPPPSPYGSLGSYPPLGHHGPSLLSGHGIPTSLAHVPQSNPMIRPSPPPMPLNTGQLNSGPSKISMSLPITSSGPPTQIDFTSNLSTSTAHQMQQQALNNQAAAAAAALSLPYGSPYFNSNSPLNTRR